MADLRLLSADDLVLVNKSKLWQCVYLNSLYVELITTESLNTHHFEQGGIEEDEANEICHFAVHTNDGPVDVETAAYQEIEDEHPVISDGQI